MGRKWTPEQRAKRKEWREVVKALDAAFTRRGYLRVVKDDSD